MSIFRCYYPWEVVVTLGGKLRAAGCFLEKKTTTKKKKKKRFLLAASRSPPSLLNVFLYTT